MSQFNIRSLREISDNPSAKFLNTLSKRLSTFLNKEQTDKLENKEDIYSAGQDTEAVVRFHDLNSTKRFTFDKQYFPPIEPDFDKVTLWIRGRNVGSSTSDISGFSNHGTINGDPLLMDGTPFDLGIHDGGVKSTCLRFNRPTSALENTEFIRVLDTSRLRLSTVSMSFFIRFRVSSTAAQGSASRTLFSKIDDDTPNDAYMLQITSSGRLRFFITDGGVEFGKETASGTIATDTVYEVFCTYTVSGSVLKIYVNAVDKSLTDIGSSPTWQSTRTNHDLSIFRKGEGTSGGHVYGDLYDFRIYKTKTISFNPIGNSVNFDGSNDYIDCTNDATLWSQSLTKFSFSFWIYPTAGWDTFNRRVVNHGGTNSSTFRVEISSSTTGEIRFMLRDSVPNSFQASTDTLTLNQWNHIVCVYDNSLGSANAKLYRNGVLGSDTGVSTAAINGSFTLELGESSTDFKGNMKDFRWWTTKALTQQEVTNVYNNIASAPACNYWLKMTEATGTPTDLITGTKTASFQNGVSWVDNEVGNMYTNKWTIADIPYGQVMVTDYYATSDLASQTGFTTTGYTTTGYNT